MWPSTAYGRRAQASRRNEREPLARSGPQVASSGATDEATSATAGATATNPAGLTGVTPRNTTGGSRVSRSPEFRSPLRGGGGGGGSGGSSSNSNSSPWPLPRPSSARGSQYAEGAVQRGRAVTSARPSDDLAWPSLSPFIALERRSSLGYEGLPEMPLGRGVNLEAGELEEEPEQWKVGRGRSSNTADDTRGGLEHAQAPSAKRKSIRWVAEVDKEDALLRAVTFLEDALGYRRPAARI